MAVVLMPDAPMADWLGQLDGQLSRSPRFFDGRPVVLDVSGLPDADPSIIVAALAQRGIRVIGMEGLDPEKPEVPGLPPSLPGGRNVGLPVLVADAPAPEPEPPPEPTGLVIDRPVRSGQSVTHTIGDVTVIGSVASGSEVIAGGSIHVYGTLRGRAIAGVAAPGSRIFCRRLEAELLAIDGVYRTADEIDPALMGHAVQVWRDGDALAITIIE